MNKNIGENKPYFSFQWHITDRCDQRCKHCYIYSAPDNTQYAEMSFKELDITLEYCLAFCNRFGYRPWFFITGGDPLLHPDFWMLLQKFKDGNYPFTIMGNPFHIDDGVALRLFEMGCRQYQMSIDGLRTTHDAIRQKGSFDETLRKVSCLKNAGIPITIATTISDMNIDEIIELMDIMAKNQVSSYSFSRLCSVDNSHTNGINPTRYRELFDSYFKKAQQLKKQGYTTKFGIKDNLLALYNYEIYGQKIFNTKLFSLVHKGCSCGKSHLTILPNGEIWACRRVHNSKVGSIWDFDFEDVWLNKMENYRRYEEFEKCSKCELNEVCRGCPAVAHSYKGLFYAADPQCWKTVN